MSPRQYETVIIGGGQAGLATAYHLIRRGLSCVILDENDEVGASWRNRWDSLRLFTPARYSHLPGMRHSGSAWSIPGKDDMAGYLKSYASRFGLPVQTGVKVIRLSTDGEGYNIKTNNELISAHNVVVATGAFHHPRIPEFAKNLAPHIVQMHSSEYQNPTQVQRGPVLMVGAGQSGAEIAIEMARDHEVWLSGRDTGEEPTSPGTLAHRLIAPIMVFAATKVLHVANPLGRKLRKHFFYPRRGIPRAGGTKKRLKQAGVKWVERTIGVHNGNPGLQNGQVLKVANVIWCTGYLTDYSWIDLPIFDEYGYPVHERGVVKSYPGLYFMGLPFQSTLSSVLIMGMGKDAEYITNHIASLRTGNVAYNRSDRQESNVIPTSP